MNASTPQCPANLTWMGWATLDYGLRISINASREDGRGLTKVKLLDRRQRYVRPRGQSGGRLTRRMLRS